MMEKFEKGESVFKNVSGAVVRGVVMASHRRALVTNWLPRRTAPKLTRWWPRHAQDAPGGRVWCGAGR